MFLEEGVYEDKSVLGTGMSRGCNFRKISQEA